MKRSLFSVALLAVAEAPSAFALTETATFNWLNIPVPVASPAVQVSTITPFSGVGRLTDVTINITGGKVTATATSQNQETYPITASLFVNGTHTVSINGLPLINNSLNGSSSPLTISGGATQTFSISAALGGGGAAMLSANQCWSEPVRVYFAFTGATGITKDPTNAKTVEGLSIISTGIGSVTYTYTLESPVCPEAETYVAGFAMAGMVGYGFFCRSRKASLHAQT